ncbi:MAG: ATP-binding protein [Actinomycetota bacterium]|nr:ATP-binding protein [Actinomycetota bacterium]
MNASICDFTLELPPVESSVAKARHAARRAAESAGASEEDVALAVSEAVGNSVVHAFRFGKEGSILVRAEGSSDELVVVVQDDGVGMIPDLDRPGLGLGTSLISRLSKEATFESSENGTTVTMRFELKEKG